MLRELVGPTPTNTMKLCQGKQIWREAEEGNEEGVTEKEKERERERERAREMLPKANSNIWGLRQT